MKSRHGYLINNEVKIKGVSRNKRGFTLIELIISLALVSLIIVAAYSFLGSTNKLLNVSVKRSDAQSQLRVIMDGLKKEVWTSSSVKISSNSSVTPGLTERMFYSGTTTLGSSYTLLLKTAGGTTLAFSDMQLKSFSITFTTSVAAPKMLTVTMSTPQGYSLTGTILAPNVISIGGVLTGNTLTCVSAMQVIPTPPYDDLDTMFSNTITAIDKSTSSTGCVFSSGSTINGKMYISTSKAVSFSGGMPLYGDLDIDSDQSIDINSNGGHLGNNIVLNTKGTVSLHDSQFPLGNISIAASTFNLNNATVTCTDFNVITSNVINSAGVINASGNISMKSPVINLNSSLTYNNMLLDSNSITKSSWEAVSGIQAYATSKINYGSIWMNKIGCIVAPLPTNINVYNNVFDSNLPQIRPVLNSTDYSEINSGANANMFFFNGPKTIDWSFNN